jgi:peptidyl-prolyl cis-trans isomerase SurA
MYKRIAAVLVLAGLVQSAHAQTLFTYGKDTVTAPEFLKAYQKNNGAAGKTGNAGLNDYLDLYISSRLKVAEARALGYDTLPQMVSDLRNLRAQILPTYLNDEAAEQRLVEEAFTRGSKDIHLAHIFIAFNRNGVVDETGAQTRAGEAVAQLAKGVSFASVARTFSDDPSVKGNGGDIGWLTVFSLPYELENLAYGTAPGKTSAAYRSKGGYHIFRNLGERRAIGRLKAAQILIAFPPDASAADKARSKKLADSLYLRLLKGDDFATLATRFSNDVVSAASGGAIPEFGVGEYESAFEAKAFALAKNGALTAPFATSHGYHIVKRVDRTAPPKQSEAALAAMKEKVEASDRIQTTRDELVRKILAQLGYRKEKVTEAALWAYSDSVLNYKPSGSPLTAETVLARLDTKEITAADWIVFARSSRYKSDGSGVKAYPQLWDEFVKTTALNYYSDNLERFNPTFRAQVEEFREGNLFFEIMQRKVWGPAQADSAALEAYFKTNRDRYQWKPGADAVLFYASDAATATAAQKEIMKNPGNWKDIVAGYEDKIAADSNRFETESIPNPGHASLKPGTVTSPLVNASDNTASFAVIIRMHAGMEPRSFAEAKGLVINDYQTELETNWLNTLRAKYPVTINQPVMLGLMKNR